MSFLLSLVGKKVLAESAKNHFGQEDPYFEEVPASRLYRAFGKKKQRRRKAIPPGLSQNDSKVLTRVKRRAYRLDYSLFNLCGIRFGWGSVIGLIPFIGDAGDAALALMVVNLCGSIDGGLPSRLRLMMLMNVAIDFAIGLIPFIGDIADAMFKCNTRNAIILERHLRDKAARTIANQGRHHHMDTDPSLPDEFDRYDEEFIDESPNSPIRGGPGHTRSIKPPSKPQAARHPHRSQSRSKRNGRSQEPDLEAGTTENTRSSRRS